ncbi:MAG: hypothetical protein IKE41_02355, partial [Clostridia bacterium]|nr:hypothetical protein [Clostridia bacterium]
ALYIVTDEECNTFLELCKEFGDDEESTAMKNMVVRLKSLFVGLSSNKIDRDDTGLLDCIYGCHVRELKVLGDICKKISKEKNNDIFKTKYHYKTCSGIFGHMKKELELVLNLLYDYFGEKQTN